MTQLLRSPLHAWHVAHGAKMTAFAGWEMPLYYTSIVEEHMATRTAGGLTDVSHMGRFRFEGLGARRLLDRLLTRRVDDLAPGCLRYAFLTNQVGGILDDVLVGYFENPFGQPFFVLVVNAVNRRKDAERIGLHVPSESSAWEEAVIFADVTPIWAMFAVQGPRAEEALQPLVEIDLSTVKRFRGTATRIAHPAGKGQGAIVSRTGYTGEDGFEIIVGAEIAQGVWEALLEAGRAVGIVPTGLGARDTLRLEAALPLYGHELSENITPLEVGLDWACDWDKSEFPGREVLLERRQRGPDRKLVCLELKGRRIARAGQPICINGQMVGEITSGTFSPTLQRPIAMGYVRADVAAPGTEVEIDIRGQFEPAVVVPRPFYRKAGT